MDSNMNFRPFFSIAIPTWEINGLGAEYLDYSFNILVHQTFKDFEVVISDHSLDDSILNVVKNWSEYLDISYIRNDQGRGKIAPNLNVAMSQCSGEYIKILFQDDFLYGENALMDIKYEIDNSYNEVKWLVTACCHTRDAEVTYDVMIPFYHDKIYTGHNTISCPSVLTVKNDIDTLSFNEDLNWVVDCEYYKRCYDKFGLPTIVKNVCTVNRESEIRTTNMISEDEKQREVEMLISKYASNSNRKKLDLSRITLIAMTSVDIDNHIKALQYSSKDIKFGAVKLVCHEKPHNLPENISYHYIDKMSSIDEWNYSIIYKLSDYVDTDYAILIHSDGFIVNADSWKDKFYDYDYIGAPWPIPKDDISYRDVNGNLIRVGNSVSLRSKKLLNLAKDLDLEWKPFHGYYSEDGFIAVNYRHIYEQHGCKFADINVAKYFSHETELPETFGIIPFAFHGKYNKYMSIFQQ